MRTNLDPKIVAKRYKRFILLLTLRGHNLPAVSTYYKRIIHNPRFHVNDKQICEVKHYLNMDDWSWNNNYDKKDNKVYTPDYLDNKFKVKAALAYLRTNE